MNPIAAIKSGFHHYADFGGRARQSEYWWWVLFAVLGSFVLTMADSMLWGTVETFEGGFSASTNTPLLSGLFFLATIVPGLAVSVRRLHDTDRSGLWLLIVLIPLIGAIMLIVWFTTSGTPGENRFGPDPRASPDRDRMAGASSIPRVPRD